MQSVHALRLYTFVPSLTQGTFECLQGQYSVQVATEPIFVDYGLRFSLLRREELYRAPLTPAQLTRAGVAESVIVIWSCTTLWRRTRYRYVNEGSQAGESCHFIPIRAIYAIRKEYPPSVYPRTTEYAEILHMTWLGSVEQGITVLLAA